MESQVHEDEIDLLALLQQLWVKRLWVVKVTSIFIVLGVVIALITPVKFKAETVFIPQVSESGGGAASKLGGLASLAGINLSGAMDGMSIPPSLYPNIAASIPYKMALLEELILIDGKEQALSAYFLAQPKSFISGIFSSDSKPEDVISSSEVFQLTAEKETLTEMLAEVISVSVNEKEGYVSLSVLWKDAVVAAQIAEAAKNLLQAQVIAYKLEKLNDNLTFTQTQYESKQKEFESIQDRLALFKDRNQNINSSRFKSQLQRIQAEYDIALCVVQELAKQLETAKLQVNRDTPIFTIIEPVIVPYERDQPKRSLLVLIWAFSGGVLSCGWVLIETPLKEIWTKINS